MNPSEGPPGAQARWIRLAPMEPMVHQPERESTLDPPSQGADALQQSQPGPTPEGTHSDARGQT